MNKIVDWFERIIIYILIFLMMAIILLAIAGLVFFLFEDATSRPVAFMNSDHVLEYLGYILLVLIGVELLDTIRAYLQEHIVHVEVVLEVALIAVARKIIILEFKDTPSLTLLGIAALVAALAAAFYLEKRGRLSFKKTAANTEVK